MSKYTKKTFSDDTGQRLNTPPELASSWNCVNMVSNVICAVDIYKFYAIFISLFVYQ